MLAGWFKARLEPLLRPDRAVVWLGHSYGGMRLSALLHQHPELCRTAVLAAPGGTRYWWRLTALRLPKPLLECGSTAARVGMQRASKGDK